MGAIKTITPAEVEACMRRGEAVALVDVRSPAEHRAVHAVGARNVPLDSLNPDQCKKLCAQTANGKVYVICKSGQRAKAAAEKMAAAVEAEVYVVEGGTDAWAGAGLPVEQGKGAISIERQVRIAAGSLVVLGVALSLAVHPAFIGLSAFVGCGLIFAGVTDSCMMGLLLAKMPWNQ
ncbi:MAG: inner membrane protein YgaP [Candidatus Hydrogenedentota bacterium]|jgi:rhodanese-related sulfurtransferase